MPNLEDDFRALQMAQPPWRADGLGVRGNPVSFQKQQPQVNWPAATLTHRTGSVVSGPSTPGSPEQPPSVPAS